jgi:predicted alpha/beta hydrolase family esterase
MSAVPDSVQPPSLLQTAGEARVLIEAVKAAAALPFARTRRGKARPVIVIPGFLASDTSTWALRRHLADCGFTVYPWELGVNRGPQHGTLAKFARRVRSIARRHGQPVQLVGWSLGGLLARVAANRLRGQVSRVIALGSPLTGDPNCSRLAALVQQMSGRALVDRGVRRLLRESHRVPVTSIFSRSDGVVAWQASAQPQGPHRCIEVDSSHMGMVVNPAVLDVVAQQLCKPADAIGAGEAATNPT